MINELKKIVDGCKICNGDGIKIVKTDEGWVLEDCECVKKISKDVKLIRANIPDQYWGYDIDNLSKKFMNRNKKSLDLVRKYVSSIDKRIKNGHGLWFSSGTGLGKSVIAAYVLKHAIDAGYTAYMDRASHLVNLKFRALKDVEAYDLIDYIVKEVDILVIEEIEKVFLSGVEAMNYQLYCEFLSDVYDAKKSLILTSNESRKKVLPRFQPFIQDRLKTIKEINFIGKSERETIV